MHPELNQPRNAISDAMSAEATWKSKLPAPSCLIAKADGEPPKQEVSMLASLSGEMVIPGETNVARRWPGARPQGLIGSQVAQKYLASIKDSKEKP